MFSDVHILDHFVVDNFVHSSLVLLFIYFCYSVYFTLTHDQSSKGAKRTYIDPFFCFYFLKFQPQRPGLDNICALFRVLVALDCRPTRLSQQSILTLSNFLPGYLIDVVTVSDFFSLYIRS